MKSEWSVPFCPLCTGQLAMAGDESGWQSDPQSSRVFASFRVVSTNRLGIAITVAVAKTAGSRRPVYHFLSPILSGNSMEAGIVGLPNVGKSTLFNALTSSVAAQSANYPFCTIEPNEGIVSVPDARLHRITDFIKPQKVIPSALKLVDIAGIVKGAAEGEGLGNKFLSHIRQVDAIMQVVRCFEDPDVIHVSGQVNPIADIDTIETELVLADMQTLENALGKAQRTARSGDKEAKLRVAAIEKCNAHLESEQPLRTLELPEAEQVAISSYGLMTAKPILYIANVDENDLNGEHELVGKVREHAAKTGASVACVCAKLESEIAELDEEDRAEMLADVGLEEPSLNIIAREAYRTLGLQSFFTAGETEVRAWPVRIGATAPQAAGVIHSDFERGFIRAEIYQLPELEEYKTEKDIRQAGKLRVEGKSYVMQDGDICHFLFNV
ncbi:translation-associated GTPase [Rhodopirellula europaea 6C]|uniref:Ribosome-binding ATPase YchF n=2 Tax=Rhodopirellula TaxID=265488 RepID=M2AVS4_9BACT|nr:translation-associated GTPase [Rhodopirellula europaea 6C]